MPGPLTVSLCLAGWALSSLCLPGHALPFLCLPGHALPFLCFAWPHAAISVLCLATRCRSCALPGRVLLSLCLTAIWPCGLGAHLAGWRLRGVKAGVVCGIGDKVLRLALPAVPVAGQGGSPC